MAELVAESSASSCDKENRPPIHISPKSCMFVNITVGDQTCRCLIDTGSSVSILVKSIFNKIGGDESQLQKVEQTLTTTDGTPMAVLGSNLYQIEISGYMTQLSLVIADISGVNGILGMDFLSEPGITLNIGQNKMHINGNTINLLRDGNYQCARVKLGQKVSIPPCSEIEVKAIVEGKVGHCDHSIVEPVKLLNKKGLLVARTVIDCNQSETIMSVLNLSDTQVKLQKNTLIGTIQPVESIQELSIQTGSEAVSQNVPFPEYLRPLIDNVSSKLISEQKQKLMQVLIGYQDVFVGPDGKLGRTDLVKHKIDTGSSDPIRVPPRRTSYAQKKIIEQELEKMNEQDIIEPCSSPYAAPVLLVTKKDGSIRFCVDYRKLNSQTKKDAHPLPRIDTCLESLAGAKWFSTLDLASGYWQCEMDLSSKEKTCFVTHQGTYAFKVLPFGLCNSPATFERLMDIVLRGLQWEKCLCYVDDVILFGSSFEIALENLKTVFERYRQANLKIKPSKCALFQIEVSFLGHIVNESGIKCDPTKVQKVQEWPVPSNVTELKQILGLVGYYRRFIPECSAITAPLTRLLKKNTKFVWDLNCQNAFETLKQKLVTAPVLSYPKYDEGTFILDTSMLVFLA